MPATGRALTDFPRQSSGLPPDHYAGMLDNARAGEFSDFGLAPNFVTSKPELADYAAVPVRAHRVEAEFVRFLLLGGDAGAPVHEAGVLIRNAWITGKLNLNECKVERSLHLENCVLAGGLVLNDSAVKNFAFVGSAILPINSDAPPLPGREGVAPKAVLGDRAGIGGSIFIREGSRLFGSLRMQGAEVDGDLDFGGSRFDASVKTLPPLPACEDYPDSTVKALAENVAIDLSGATIKGDLDLNSFYPRRPPDAGEATFPEPTHTFTTLGRVDLVSTKVIMQMRVIDASIRFAEAPAGLGRRVQQLQSDSAALNALGLSIGGGLMFHHNMREIAGVDLRGAKVGALVDDAGSWASGAGRNRFDGFAYERIATESAKVDRVAWLESQWPGDLGKTLRDRDGGLRLSAWDQAAKALETIGETDNARRTRVERQRAFAGTLTWRWILIWRFWDLISGFGYFKLRLALITFGIWLVGAVVATYLAEAGAVYATDKDVQGEVTGRAAAQNVLSLDLAAPGLGAFKMSAQLSGAEGDEKSGCFSPASNRRRVDLGKFALAYCFNLAKGQYPAFTPVLYSLDVLVPFVDFNQKAKWSWRSRWWREGVYFLLESIWGYLVGTALIGQFASFLFRKSD